MLGTKIVIQFIGFGFNTIAGLLILSLSARFFGPKTLGQVNYFLAILGIFLLFSDMGFSRAHIKFISDKKNISQKIGVFFRVKLALLSFFLIASLIYFFFKKQEMQNFISIYFLLVFYEFFNRLGVSFLYTFEGLQTIVLENLALWVSKIVKLSFLLLSIVFARTIFGLTLAYFSEGVTVFILSVLLLKRFRPFKFSQKIFKQYFRYSLPFFVIYPLSYIQGNVSVIMLNFFWGATDVGFYSAAVGLASFVKSMYGVIVSLLFPKMSEVFASGNRLKFQNHIDTALRYLLIIFIPIFLLMYFLKYEIIYLVLGSQFVPSMGVFSLSLLGILILMISAPFDQALYASAKHSFLAPLTVLSVFTGIIFQLLLVPKALFSFNLPGLAGEGVVIGNILAWMLTVIIQISLLHKILKVTFPWKNILIMLFGFFLIAVYLFLKISQVSIIIKLVFSSVSVIAFYFFCTKTGFFTSEDKKYFLKTLSLDKILSQGASEIKNI